MKTIKLNIELLSFWQVGSGSSRGGDVDEVMLKDDNLLPYLPGKTLKGLLREGMMICCDAGKIKNATIDENFGELSVNTGYDSGSTKGNLRFSSAVLKISDEERKAIITNGYSDMFYERFSSTKIGENGIAVDKTLRVIEVCIPVTLQAEITGSDDEQFWVKDMKEACSMVRCLGAHRNRGLGRCEISVEEGGN